MTTANDDVERARVLLRDLRASIDNIDAAIVYMLAERFRCTEEVSRLKAMHNLPPADLTREAEQIARLRRLAVDARFNPDFTEKYLNFIISHVIRHHEAVAAGEKSADLVARPA
ncbi:MAG: chorismate mutase [Bauldia sp.]|nr:MAG: chorismate mutase [Bauldia sp.]MBZ0227650.1 chorismate mutase [Bauldia sp.]